MSQLAPLDLAFRPQLVVTAEVERSTAATERLLERPSDWLRRVHTARFDVVLDPPGPQPRTHQVVSALKREGFKALCGATVRHPGPTGRIERSVEVLVDRTTTIRAEVVGSVTKRVYLSSLFDDGSSLVSVPDPTIAAWLESECCEVVCGTGDLRQDLSALRERAEGLVQEGRTPLLCANPMAYRLHLQLGTLRHSKQPRGSARINGTLAYPMTLLLAAEMIAQRDAVADVRGLTVTPNAPGDRGH